MVLGGGGVQLLSVSLIVIKYPSILEYIAKKFRQIKKKRKRPFFSSIYSLIFQIQFNLVRLAFLKSK